MKLTISVGDSVGAFAGFSLGEVVGGSFGEVVGGSFAYWRWYASRNEESSVGTIVLEHLKIYVLMHISLLATLWVLSLGFHSVRLWVDLATKDQRKDKMSALRNVILVQTCMDARNERWVNERSIFQGCYAIVTPLAQLQTHIFCWTSTWLFKRIKKLRDHGKIMVQKKHFFI